MSPQATAPDAGKHGMRLAWASVIVVGLAYFAILAWSEGQRGRDGDLLDAMRHLPVLVPLVLASLGLRWLRWHGLLMRLGHRLPAWSSLLAYVAGFALTASPGKAGELLRMRYLGPLGVPPRQVFALFLYERSLDLLVVLALATLAFAGSPAMPWVLGFVLSVVGGVATLSFSATARRQLAGLLWRVAPERMARVAAAALSGLDDLGPVLRAPTLAASAAIGACAWALLALAFLLLCRGLGISVEAQWLLGVYPLAMLAGAASFLPGGLGTTEAAIVGLLSLRDVPLAEGLTAALLIRVATLWLAIVLGLIACLRLELAAPRATRPE